MNNTFERPGFVDPASTPPRLGAAYLALALNAATGLATRRGRRDHALAMCIAAQRLHPRWETPFVMEPLIVAGTGRSDQALVMAATRNDSMSLSVRAHCLLWMGDPGWEPLAHEVLARADDEPAIEAVCAMFEIAQRPVPEHALPVQTQEASRPVLTVPFHSRGIRA